MTTRLFALLIGIDHYKSGAIWDLNSCVEDAERMKRFFMNDLNVPIDQICLLIDRHATKHAIENAIVSHLVKNPAIQPGDAMVVYFAGHGSTVPAPPGWFQGEARSVHRRVEVLCPYDYDTKKDGGRLAGISSRSMHALLEEVARSKGNNITFITDCCFSPLNSDVPGRGNTRWTPSKVRPNDLYAALWHGTREHSHVHGLGFYEPNPESHVFLAACGQRDTASEGKDGGRFTHSFLRVAANLSLHRTSYSAFFDRLTKEMESDNQRPICLGKFKSRIIFDSVPFVVDQKYVPTGIKRGQHARLEMGAQQGVVTGSEFSLHLHNFCASRNPSIGTVVVFEVHPTWSVAHLKNSLHSPPSSCWAQITRWNNRHPFKVHFKKATISLFHWLKANCCLIQEFDGRSPPELRDLIERNTSEKRMRC